MSVVGGGDAFPKLFFELFAFATRCSIKVGPLDPVRNITSFPIIIVLKKLGQMRRGGFQILFSFCIVSISRCIKNEFIVIRARLVLHRYLHAKNINWPSIQGLLRAGRSGHMSSFINTSSLMLFDYIPLFSTSASTSKCDLQ